MRLNEVAKEIRDLIQVRQESLGLVFEENKHIYTMNGRKDYPSVSKVLKKFYKEFPTEEAAYNKAGGDPQRQQELIEEWAAAGQYSTNLGSRVHYLLEKKTMDKFGAIKELRQPEFVCDIEQMIKGDAMISAGSKFLTLMEKRGAILLDTEMVLGDPTLGYTGQPDKIWIMENKSKTGFGFVITDWKTNKPKNFESNRFTKKMKDPFTDVDDTALGHYYVQLPLYVKLFLEMMKGTKYENMRVFGGIIVLLQDDSDFKEYRIPKQIMGTVLEMDMKKYLI